MKFIETFTIAWLAEKSGVEYHKLRRNLLARQEGVKLTREERDLVISAARDRASATDEALKELEAFLA